MRTQQFRLGCCGVYLSCPLLIDTVLDCIIVHPAGDIKPSEAARLPEKSRRSKKKVSAVQILVRRSPFGKELSGQSKNALLLSREMDVEICPNFGNNYPGIVFAPNAKRVRSTTQGGNRVNTNGV